MKKFKEAAYNELFVKDYTNISILALWALSVGLNLMVAGGIMIQNLVARGKMHGV